MTDALFWDEPSFKVLPLWSLAGLLNEVALWAQVCAWLFACGNESQESHSTNRYWNRSASRLIKKNNLMFPSKKTSLNTNSLMHNGYGFPDIHFEQKNIASHCIESEMLFMLYMRCCCFWAIWHLVATCVHCNYTTKCFPALIFMGWPVERLPHLNRIKDT